MGTDNYKEHSRAKSRVPEKGTNLEGGPSPHVWDSDLIGEDVTAAHLLVKFARAPRQVETISLDCSQDKAGKQGTMTGTGKNTCHWDTRWLGRICLSTG